MSLLKDPAQMESKHGFATKWHEWATRYSKVYGIISEEAQSRKKVQYLPGYKTIWYYFVATQRSGYMERTYHSILSYTSDALCSGKSGLNEAASFPRAHIDHKAQFPSPGTSAGRRPMLINVSKKHFLLIQESKWIFTDSANSVSDSSSCICFTRFSQLLIRLASRSCTGSGKSWLTKIG